VIVVEAIVAEMIVAAEMIVVAEMPERGAMAGMAERAAVADRAVAERGVRHGVTPATAAAAAMGGS